MGFTAPAVHYSALATLPPELTTSKSQQSLKHKTTTIQFKLTQIIKRILTNDIHNEHPQSSKPLLHSSDTVNKENTDDLFSSHNNSGNQICIEQESSKLISPATEPLERIPFTEPYFSKSVKKEKFPFELSTYHKNCIHQQSFTKTTQLNSPSSSSSKNYHPNSRLGNSIDRLHSIKSDSTTTLPASTSIENHIGLQYASQKSTLPNSSYIQQRLRRLHSKPKLRPISNETKSSPISSSIAQRIELLKQSMHNNHLEFSQCKPEKPSTSIDSIHKQTQTNNTNQLKSSEVHYIHHHHIHSSSYLSISWRTYLSILGIFLILLIFLIELITIIF